MKTINFSIVFIFCFIQINNKHVLGRLDSKSALRIITQYGYPVEEHTNIETKDGYLLDMQRIPYGIKANSSNSTNKPTILLMHGILSSAENWIVTGPEKGLAFILADAGYDVWMGNARGNTHSRKHKRLNPDLDRDFWQFSWHEIGIYDLPAKIDYILEKTGQTQIYYLGHSQGTTSFFVMCSVLPRYNQKIRLMVALAPVVYMSNLSNPIFRMLAQLERGLNWFLSIVGNAEFLPNNEMMSLLGEAMCNERAVIQEVCTNIIFLIVGYDSTEMNRTALSTIMSTLPAGASTKQFLHYAQGVISGSFRYYDYDIFVNNVIYGSASPPTYKLNRVSAPVALFYSKNDWLVSPKDVVKLKRQLPNVVYSQLLPYERFNHFDYLFASDVVPMVYQKVLDLLKQY